MNFSFKMDFLMFFQKRQMILPKSTKNKKNFKYLHTSLVHVMVGTGLPDALHSKATSVPFLTTMFPSSGLGLTLGGTKKKWITIITQENAFEKMKCSFCFSTLAHMNSSLANVLLQELIIAINQKFLVSVSDNNICRVTNWLSGWHLLAHSFFILPPPLL